MRKKAVGIGYDKEKDSAPKLVAKGEGLTAEKIIEIAKEYGVHVKEDKALIEILYKLDLGEEIPEELYSIMAEIFMYIYELEKRV